MTFTRARDLVSAALIAALLAHLVLKVSYGDLPALPRFAGLPLLAFAIAELVLGWSLRARIMGKPGTRPVHAFAAVKAVALAKASSLAGAITAGAWLGVLVYVLPQRAALAPAAADTVSALIGLVCAAALVAAGLWLEHCCRIPEPPDERRPDDADSDRHHLGDRRYDEG